MGRCRPGVAFWVCCWLVWEREEAQTDRQTDRGGEKAERESVREGGMSRSPNHSARLGFIWQLLDGGPVYKRPPTPASDLRPASTPETNSAVLAISTGRREGWAVIGGRTRTQRHTCFHLGHGKDTYRCVCVCVHVTSPPHTVCECNTWMSSDKEGRRFHRMENKDKRRCQWAYFKLTLFVVV